MSTQEARKFGEKARKMLIRKRRMPDTWQVHQIYGLGMFDVYAATVELLMVGMPFIYEMPEMCGILFSWGNTVLWELFEMLAIDFVVYFCLMVA